MYIDVVLLGEDPNPYPFFSTAFPLSYYLQLCHFDFILNEKTQKKKNTKICEKKFNIEKGITKYSLFYPNFHSNIGKIMSHDLKIIIELDLGNL